MKILVIGGTGFIGREIVQHLQIDHEVKILSRQDLNHPNSVQGDITDFESLSDFSNWKSDLVINCVGISPIKYHPDNVYEASHVLGIQNILKLMKLHEIKNLIHISAIGAEKDSDFIYMKTKHAAEELIKDSLVNYMIIRPSMVLGENNELESMVRSLSVLNWTVLPRFGSVFQPIHVNDLAEFIKSKVNSFDGLNPIREVVEVGGPNTYQLSEILYLSARLLGVKVIYVPVPRFIINLGLRLGALLHLTNHNLGQYIWKESVVRSENCFLGEGDYLRE